ncbi:hypothetical protein [Fulvimarina sp. MAC3]|uniref:hypothetical protein n=1 Tax=Fulvimarina sp. MAC3 TaxID=3148887 RepID=UPI0031FD914B
MSALAHLEPDGSPDSPPEPVRHRGFPLERYRNQLDGTIDGIETIFLRIGESLLACVGLLGDMREAFGAITEAHAGPEVAEAEAAIRGLVRECQGLLEATHREHQIVVELTRIVTSAGSQVEALRQTVSMISAIAVNARVIAAGTRCDGETELAVFTDDIHEFIKRTADVVDRLTKGQSQLRTLLVSASVKSEAFERNFARATEWLKDRIEADLAAAVEDRARASKTSGLAKETCASLSGQVSRIVSSMQVGDNTRQRLEHVSAGLAIAEKTPEAEYAILELQCAQMSGTRVDLVQETGSLREALLVLSADIDHSFGALKSELVGTGARHDAPGTARLGPDIAQASTELSRSKEEQERVAALARSITEDVAAFNTRASEIRQLEFEMRLVSLNTAIGCSRLGKEGIALGVVSHQMREVVGDMVTQSEALSAVLSNLGQLADDLGQVRANAADRGIAELVSEAERALSILSLADERLGSAGSVLDAVGGRIAGLTSDVGEGLGNLEGLIETLSGVETALGIRVATGEGRDPSVIARHADLFAKLRKAYTMEAERKIHDEVTGAEPVPAEETANAAAEDDLDAFLF